MAYQSSSPSLDVKKLRDEIRAKYYQVATNPEQEFHLNHGRHLVRLPCSPDDNEDNSLN